MYDYILDDNDIILKNKIAKFLNNIYKKHGSKNIIRNDNIILAENEVIAIKILINNLAKDNDIVILDKPYDDVLYNFLKKKKLEIKIINICKDGYNLNVLLNILKNNQNCNIFYYTMPFCHNISCISTSFVKKMILTNFSKKYKNLNIIANETFEFSIWNREKFKQKYYLPLSILCDERAYSISNFSNILYPNLNLTWILSKNKINIESNYKKSLINVILDNLIENNLLEKIIKKQNENLEIKYNKIVNKLKELNLEYIDTKNGYNILITVDNNEKFYNLIDLYKIKFKYVNFEDNKINLKMNYSLYSLENCILGIDKLDFILKIVNKYKILILDKKNVISDLNLDNNKYHIFKDDINLLPVVDLVVLNDKDILNEILNNETNNSIIILNNNYDLNLLKLSSKKKSINIIKGIPDSLVMINELLNNLKENKNKNILANLLKKNINWIEYIDYGLYIDQKEYKDKLSEETNIIKYSDLEYIILKDINNLDEFKKRKKEFKNLHGYLIIHQELLNNNYEYKFTCKYYNKNFEIENFDIGSVYSIANFLILKYNLKEYEFILNDLKNEYYVDNGNSTLSLSFPKVDNILLSDKIEDEIREKVNFDFFKVDEIMLYSKDKNCLVIECYENVNLIDSDIIFIIGNLINEIMIKYGFNNTILVFLYVKDSILVKIPETIHIRIFDTKINEEVYFSGLGILSSFEFYKNLYENNSTLYLEKKIKLINDKNYLISLSNGNTFIDLEYFEDDDGDEYIELD